MQDTFGVIMLALVNNEPKTLNLKRDAGHTTWRIQKDVIVRRTILKRKRRRTARTFWRDLRIALDHIDEVIETIRSSYDTAKQDLMERFGTSDVQAQSILDMRLARLAGIEREKIDNEYRELMEKIKYLTSVLEQEHLVYGDY